MAKRRRPQPRRGTTEMKHMDAPRRQPSKRHAADEWVLQQFPAPRIEHGDHRDYGLLEPRG